LPEVDTSEKETLVEVLCTTLAEKLLAVHFEKENAKIYFAKVDIHNDNVI
jgi:hypothetical protein